MTLSDLKHLCEQATKGPLEKVRHSNSILALRLKGDSDDLVHILQPRGRREQDRLAELIRDGLAALPALIEAYEAALRAFAAEGRDWNGLMGSARIVAQEELSQARAVLSAAQKKLEAL